MLFLQLGCAGPLLVAGLGHRSAAVVVSWVAVLLAVAPPLLAALRADPARALRVE